MNMQESDFRRALEIITRNNRITVSFNTPIADNYSQVYPHAYRILTYLLEQTEDWEEDDSLNLMPFEETE